MIFTWWSHRSQTLDGHLALIECLYLIYVSCISDVFVALGLFLAFGIILFVLSLFD